MVSRELGLQPDQHGTDRRGMRTLDEVGHILEGACLLAVPIDGQRRSRQRLRHKVADHAAGVQRHPRSVGVEDAHNSDLRAAQRSAASH